MKMTLNDEQYELIGRWLDGEAVELNEAEQRVAEQIRADRASVAERLDVQLPAAAVARALARMRSALAGRRRRKLVFTYVVPPVAAAIVLIVAGLFLFEARTVPVPSGDPTVASLAAIDEAELLDVLVEPDPELLAADLEHLEYELFLAAMGVHDEQELRRLEDELEQVWLDPLVLALHDPIF